MGVNRCKFSTQILPACFAWGFFLILTIIFFAFPCRYIFTSFKQTGVAITIYDAVLSLIVFAHFLAATVIEPGKYPRAHEHEIESANTRTTLQRNIDINGVSFRMKWCTTCQFYRPPRCSHCSVCDMCIDTFDHHCPWVNNCIGRRNYRFFALFLLSLWVHMISVLVLTILAIMKWKKEHGNISDVIPIVSIIECCLVSLFLIPVTGLSAFHIFLISRGRTTNEQVTGKIKDFNPFGRGCLMNWIFVFWGPRAPSLLNRKERKDLMNKVKMSKPPGGSIEDVVILIQDNQCNKPGELEEKHPDSSHSKTDFNLTDDTKSMASSIVSDFRFTQRQLANSERYKNTASTNNLIRGEMTSSLSEYYITVDGNSESSSRTDTHVDTARLLASTPQEAVVNGNSRNVEENGSGSAAEEESIEDDESAALLIPAAGESSNKVTTI